ncbi:hypothetical protein [Paraburkholderia youngii]|uniref:Uncharacterized protein n=1 Tax=Paraburkholderia youngii TaxID=2782701 RepID=A0A7W8L9T5_9BURK|nr:hypothetical protein [Paraburkholderia youngii]MBB5402663.1 hypothetical protein [Paraburkholderia youngii]
MDFGAYTDAQLDDMRATLKTIVNPAARWVTKGSHREKNFQLVALRDIDEKYRVFVRVSEHNPSVFSAGLVRVFDAERSLVLARYNGGYHPHRNVLERTKVPAICHRHLATQRYIQAGLDPDGFAEPIEGYNTVEGAFEILSRHCGIAGEESAPPEVQRQGDLF